MSKQIKKEVVAEVTTPEIKESQDVKVETETLVKSSKEITEGDRVKYVPSQAFKLLFPDGYQLFLNGILINLVFDGRAYYFTPKIRDYVETKLEKIAAFESDKLEHFNDPKRFFKNIG